jgi:CPA1 family monovalent cation:H+ antiporter
MGVRGPRILPARIRLQGFFVWDILDFLVNATLFVLIGLQLRMVRGRAPRLTRRASLRGTRSRSSAVVVATRLVWLFTVPYLIRALDRRPSQRARRSSASWRLVIGWSGMRGAVSLAGRARHSADDRRGRRIPAARPDHLPDVRGDLLHAGRAGPVAAGADPPPRCDRRRRRRGRGAARPPVRDEGRDQPDRRPEREEWTRDETIERMRAMYQYRKRRLAARAGKIEDDGYEDRSLAYQQMVQIVLSAQREASSGSARRATSRTRR